MITVNRNSLAFYAMFALLTLGLPSIGRAQNADVKAAVDANHAAIHSLDIAEIATIWSHGADVTLVNPNDKSVAVGWDAVKGRWEKVFSIMTGVDIKQTEGPYVTVTGDTARSIGIVHVIVHLKSQDPKETDFVETDVFMKQDGHWLVVSHTAKPI